MLSHIIVQNVGETGAGQLQIKLNQNHVSHTDQVMHISMREIDK